MTLSSPYESTDDLTCVIVPLAGLSAPTVPIVAAILSRGHTVDMPLTLRGISMMTFSSAVSSTVGSV